MILIIIPLNECHFQVDFEILQRFFMINACTLEKSGILVESFSDNGVPSLKIFGSDIDVNKTFDCGQSFRFEKVEDSRHECEYSGVAFGKFVSFANDGNTLYIYNATEDELDSVWADYLGLYDDYSAIALDITSRSDSKALKNAVDFGRGIHILRQEPWETLCSFIISQNNNIPRIKKIISALSERCGEEINTENMTSHGAKAVSYAFPSAEAVMALGEEGIFALKTGFRAKYIYDAASRVSCGALDLSAVCDAATLGEAAEMLCAVKGVGPKVAACALLFGFGRKEAFPIDVWIKRAIEKYFPGEFSADRLGEYAGIAQQYLFYYERYLGGE